MHCEAHAEGQVYVQTAVSWLNHMSLTSLQPCRTVLFGALSCLLGLLEAVQKDPVSAMAE